MLHRFLLCFLAMTPLNQGWAGVTPSENSSGGVFRVLVVGDSWADIMWDQQSLRTVFALEDHPEILEKGDVTAISGSTAAEWATASFLQLITDELNANPTIDIVQLTMGGNDFLAGMSGGGWFVGMSPAEEEALFNRVADDILTVIAHILNLDPDISIILSFYDYPNFQETLSGLLGFLCTDLWEGVGEPTPLELNQALLDMVDRMDALAATLPEVSLVRHAGLMQNHFGYPSMGIPPGQILPPGDPVLPSPPEALRFAGSDCFHLNAAGYQVLAQNLWDFFYIDVFCLTQDQFRGHLPAWPGATDLGELTLRVNRLCE